jgi:hypothetical protein
MLAGLDPFAAPLAQSLMSSRWRDNIRVVGFESPENIVVVIRQCSFCGPFAGQSR